MSRSSPRTLTTSLLAKVVTTGFNLLLNRYACRKALHVGFSELFYDKLTMTKQATIRENDYEPCNQGTNKPCPCDRKLFVLRGLLPPAFLGKERLGRVETPPYFFLHQRLVKVTPSIQEEGGGRRAQGGGVLVGLYLSVKTLKNEKKRREKK